MTLLCKDVGLRQPDGVWDNHVEAMDAALAALGSPPKIHDEALSQQENNKDSDLGYAASLLEEAVSKRVLLVSDDLASRQSMSKNLLLRNLEAAAELSAAEQERLLPNVVQYLKHALHIAPVAFIEYCAFDETQMAVAVDYGDGIEREIARVFVIQSEWALLVATKEGDTVQNTEARDFTLLRGVCAPAVRAANRTTAAATVKVLETLAEPPKELQPLVKHWVRVVETDGAKSNHLAETWRSLQRPHCLTLHLECQAHRMHTASVKTWALAPDLISGLVRTLLVLGGTHAMRRMRKALDVFIQQKTRIIRNSVLSDDAVAYRRLVIEQFAPPAKEEPRRRAMVIEILQSLLNGDLRRQGTVEHYCTGCCTSPEESIAKLRKYVPKLFSSPCYFAKNDWLHWDRPWLSIGLWASCHGLFAEIFLATFGEGADLDEAAGMEPRPRRDDDDVAPGGGPGRPPHDLQHPQGEDDAEQAPRADAARAKSMSQQERAQVLKQAVAWVRSSPWNDLFVMHASLRPEAQLIRKVLYSTRTENIHDELLKHLEGQRSYHVLELLKGRLLDDCVQEATRILMSSSSFDHLPETEYMRSNIMRCCMRGAAFVWAKIKTKVQSYPFKIFALIDNRSEALAASLLEESTCACLLDPWSRAFFQAFPTQVALLSEECHQLLVAVASLAICDTFSVERLHSRNARRARARGEGHKPQLKFLGLHHEGYAGPAFLKPPPTQPKDRRPRGRPMKVFKRPSGGHLAEGRSEAGHHEAEGGRKGGRRGGGGAWRYFVFKHTHGSQLSAERMRALGRNYRALSHEEKQRYTAAGRAGGLGSAWVSSGET